MSTKDSSQSLLCHDAPKVLCRRKKTILVDDTEQQLLHPAGVDDLSPLSDIQGDRFLDQEMFPGLDRL